MLSYWSKVCKHDGRLTWMFQERLIETRTNGTCYRYQVSTCRSGDFYACVIRAHTFFSAVKLRSSEPLSPSFFFFATDETDNSFLPLCTIQMSNFVPIEFLPRYRRARRSIAINLGSHTRTRAHTCTPARATITSVTGYAERSLVPRVRG